LYKSYQNQFQYLKKLKVENAKYYWELWRKATERVKKKHGDNPPEEPEKPGDYPDDVDDSQDAETLVAEHLKPAATSKKQKTSTTPPRPPKSPPRLKKTVKISSPPPTDKMSEYYENENDDGSVGASTITTRTTLFGSVEGKGAKKSLVCWTNPARAISFADQHFVVDLKDPR
jgi:hypothetical protein